MRNHESQKRGTSFTQHAVRLTRLAVLPVALALAVVTPAQASTKISSCPIVINTPGVYAVTKDLTCSGTAITIVADNVDLDLKGHTVSGDGSGDGIFVQGGSDVSVRHGTVRNFEVGIRLSGSVENKLVHLTLTQNATGILGESDIDTTVMHNDASENGISGILLVGSRGNTVAHNSANQNGAGAIVLLDNASENNITDNTANQNGILGIGLDRSQGNTLKNNVANQNSDRGISLNDSSGNTLKKNTTDENGSGITLSGDSHENIVMRNSATANGGEGIRLYGGPTQNMVQDNTVTGNSIGIRLFTAERPVGASHNTVLNNTAVGNGLGVVLEVDSAANRVHGNIALDNEVFDLGDLNAGCDANTWTHNEFVTDRVAGADDGGPGTGCIR